MSEDHTDLVRLFREEQLSTIHPATSTSNFYLLAEDTPLDFDWNLAFNDMLRDHAIFKPLQPGTPIKYS